MKEEPTQFEAGPMSSWSDFRFQMEGLPPASKKFLKEEMSLSSTEVSLNSMPPGAGMPFLHRHRQNEELYIFLEGSGEFQLGEEIYPIQSGSCIKVPPSTARSWRNTGEVALISLCIQARHNSYTEGKTVEDGELVPRRPEWA